MALKSPGPGWDAFVAAAGTWDKGLAEGDPGDDDWVREMEEARQDDARREEQALQTPEQESERVESSSETESDKEEEEEEEESDTEEESFHFEADNGWVSKRVSPEANGGLPNYSKGAYDKDYWDCTLAGKGRFVTMKDTIHGGEYTVPIKRVNKALRHLHLPSVAATLRACSGVCRCKREPKCFQRGLDTLSILTHRHTFFSSWMRPAQRNTWPI
jgi:hypothetical protein